MPSSLLIAITWLCSLVTCAIAVWVWVSRSTPSPKSKRSSEPTPNSDASALAQIQADQAALFSTLEKLTTTVKRLSTRHGMRDAREREAAEAEAPPSTKTEALRKLGLAGMVGPNFTRRAQEIERGSN